VNTTVPGVLCVLRRHGKVAEQQRFFRGAVIGVLLPKRVRVDPQAPHELVAVAFPGPHRAIGPERHAAERALEMTNRRHRHGIDHLLVKLRIGLRGGEAVLGEQVRMIEIDRMIEDAAGRIVVDHFDVFAHRTRLEILPRNLGHDFVETGGVELRGQARIESEDAQPPAGGRTNRGGVVNRGHEGKGSNRTLV
jgi:hypothetical protein